VKTILIPTDFSGASKSLLKFGLPFLQNTQEEFKVLLLNTFQVPYANPNEMVASHDELKRKSQERLLEEVGQLKKEINSHLKVSFEALPFLGSLENVIWHVAREEKADLVILGVNGSSQKKEPLQRFLHHLDCPVLLFPIEK
jgi:nucleotide-binding universal stress UspA family protein